MLQRNINNSVETMSFSLTKGKAMTETIAKLIERLAEMFPKQNYQTKLDAYLQSKNIQDVSDVEHWTREYDRRQGSF
jgi:translation elongation factor EF-4